MAANIFSSASWHKSANAERLAGTKRRSLRRMNAASRWRSDAPPTDTQTDILHGTIRHYNRNHSNNFCQDKCIRKTTETADLVASMDVTAHGKRVKIIKIENRKLLGN